MDKKELRYHAKVQTKTFEDLNKQYGTLWVVQSFGRAIQIKKQIPSDCIMKLLYVGWLFPLPPHLR